jgi:hypothetical protein
MATTSTSTVNSSSPPSSSDATSTPSLSSSSTESPLPLSSSTPSPPTTTLATNYAGINASLLLPVESRGGGGGLDNAEEAVGNGLGTARGKPGECASLWVGDMTRDELERRGTGLWTWDGVGRGQGVLVEVGV